MPIRSKYKNKRGLHVIHPLTSEQRIHPLEQPMAGKQNYDIDYTMISPIN